MMMWVDEWVEVEEKIIGVEKDGVLSVRMLDDFKVDDWCCYVEGGSELYGDIICDFIDLEVGR